jgi:hypothetical protein
VLVRRLIPLLAAVALIAATGTASAQTRINYPLDRVTGSGIFVFQSSVFPSEWDRFTIQARSGPNGEFATGTWEQKWDPWRPVPNPTRGTIFCLSMRGQAAVIGLRSAGGGDRLITMIPGYRWGTYNLAPAAPGTCPPVPNPLIIQPAADSLYGGRYHFTDSVRPDLPGRASDCADGGYARYRVGYYRLFDDEDECRAAVRAGWPLYNRIVLEALRQPVD